jgi:hypothetical protein
MGTNKVTMQLLSKGTNGEITLQYMGTKVLKFIKKSKQYFLSKLQNSWPTLMKPSCSESGKYFK